MGKDNEEAAACKAVSGHRVSHAGLYGEPEHDSGNIYPLIIKLVKVTRPGIEPRTFWTYTKHSNQLSYY
jgi:hypothetical protein